METIQMCLRKGKYATIIDVSPLEFDHPIKGRVKKLKLTFIDDRGRTFEAADIWHKDKIKGLYFSGNIIFGNQALGKLMIFLKVQSTKELIGKRLYLAPRKWDNFLVPTITNPNHDIRKTKVYKELSS